jgi:hypothetical protein
VRLRLPRRDIIVRIDRGVRFARLCDGAIAEAIWARLPCYGAAERTRDGALAFALEMPMLPKLTSDGARPSETGLDYCALTQRIVFPSATLDTTVIGRINWAQLAEPYPFRVLDSVPQGVRISLLHADA